MRLLSLLVAVCLLVACVAGYLAAPAVGPLLAR